MYGQMHKPAYLSVFFHNAHDVFRKIFGMARHKTHAKFSVDRRDCVQKLRKRHTCFSVRAVRIDVLPKKSNFTIPFRNQFFDFGKDMFGLSGAFSAPHVRNDTIGTKIIAAVHDIHPSVGIAGTVRVVRFDDFPFLLAYFDYFLLLSAFTQNQIAKIF